MSEKEQITINNIGKASCVKFTPQEYNHIHKVQKATGATIPTLLKNAFFKKTKNFSPLMDKESVLQVLSELRRIGNNINQITKHLNAGFGYESCKGFPEICKELALIRKTVVEKSGINQG